MKFLVDMNLSPSWVGYLVSAGFEAVHWSAIGPSDAEDTELLHWAAEHDRIVLTCDLGFGAILAATSRKRPSVVQIRAGNLAPANAGPAVLSAIRAGTAELQDGALLSVDAGRGRLRILPLKSRD